MLSMRQQDLGNNIIEVLKDLDNYPDHSVEDVLPKNEEFEFNAYGALLYWDEAEQRMAPTGLSLSEDVLEYRTDSARGL